MRLVGLQWTRLPPRFPPVFSRLVQTEREPAKAKVRFVVHGAADEKNHEWGGQGRSSLIAPTSPIEPTLDGKKPRPYIRFVSLERPGSTQESQNNISKKVIGPVPETHTRREEVREEARVVLSDTQGQRSLFQKILTTAKYRRRLETKGKSVEQITASQKTSANSQAESTASQRANGVSKRSRKRKSKSRPLVRLAYPKEDAAPNETSISTGETTKSSTSISHDTSSTGSGTRESKDGTGQIRIVKVRNRRSSKHTSVSGSNEGDLHHSKTKDQEQSIQSGHTDNMRKSKVTIDALLQSITKPKPLISPKGLQTSLEQSAPSTTPPPDTPAKHLPAEDVGAVNHILCLENCGFTMIKSDIERIFSNHEALVRGWQIYGMDLTLSKSLS
ncbi:hypothetical protein Dda_1515 [Drechslerella dactyloides]|uniref:Uncharacterized protein n=1 Tax=Drechslerella dactyloides TaxID=74499 RepID=A0AAD6NLW0_DREDA|nr:hypothetical protein Dda_1515 [Drechslerella dactyloides]